MIEEHITKFFNNVKSIDRQLNCITTRDDKVYNFAKSRTISGHEWVIVKLAEENYIPFCISIWIKENSH